MPEISDIPVAQPIEEAVTEPSGAPVPPPPVVEEENLPTVPEVAPPAPAPNDDLTQDYTEHREQFQNSALIQDMESRFGGEATEEAAVDPSAPRVPNAAARIKTTGYTTQIVGGIRDATQEMMDLAAEISPIGSMYSMATGKERPKAPQLPDVAAPGNMSEGLVRGVSQFLTGFAGAGAATKGMKVGKAASAAIKGAIADFTAFDGHDKNLSNLIQEFPALKNPVSEFLASDPNDSDLVGRTKKTLEGLGLGAATEGMIKALKYVSIGRTAKAMERGAKYLEGETVPRETRIEDFASLGDASSDKLIVKKAGEVIEGGAKGEDSVFINFARIEAPEDIDKVMQGMADASKKDIEGASRGTRSWEQTKLSAEQVDAFDTLSKRRVGEPLNAEQSLAARQLWVTSAAKLQEVAKAAVAAPTEANLFNFRKMMATHQAIQKQVIGARTESARALNAWKIPAGTSQQMAKQMDELILAGGGSDLAKDMAEKIAKMAGEGMTGGIEQFIEKTALAKSSDAVAQVYYNVMLLSNPATHVANFLSSFANMFQQVGERKVGEYLSQTVGHENGVALGEAGAMMHGMISGTKELFNLMGRSFKEEGAIGSAKKFLFEDTDAAMESQLKYDMPDPSLNAEAWGVSKETPVGRMMDVVDTVTRTNGRVMGKTDQMFKFLGYRMEVHAQAVRTATQELRGGKISPDAFKARVAEIVADPPASIKADAIDFAKYMTFTNQPPQTLKKIGDAVQSVPFVGRVILPFKNTPANVAAFAFERTPLAPVMKSFRADLAAGGARASLAESKIMTGSMVLALGMDAYLSGRITGRGPTEYNKSANQKRMGQQAYSVKVGNTYMSYNRVDPMGFTLGIAADLAEAMVNAQDEIGQHDFEKASIAAAFAISNNVLSKTYMRGVADFFGAVTSPDMKGQAYAQRLFSTVVPAGVAALARNGLPGIGGGDPIQRVAQDTVDAIRRRTPWLSDDLPPYRDIWGRTVDFRSGLGWTYDMFSPVYLKTEHPEAIDKEIDRLGYFPDMPERKMGIGGSVVELNPHQYSRYVELAGNGLKMPGSDMGAKDFLNAVVSGDSVKSRGMSQVYKLLDDGPDGGKAQFIKDTLTKFRTLAKRQMLSEDTGLKADFDLRRQKKLDSRLNAIQGR
jgi:hypothetical protein